MTTDPIAEMLEQDRGPERAEARLADKALDHPKLRRLMGGARSVAAAVKGEHGPTAREVASMLVDHFMNASSEPVTDEAEFGKILDGFANRMDEAFPMHGSGSPGDLDDPIGSDRAWERDVTLGRHAGGFESDERGHAADRTMWDEYRRLTGRQYDETLSGDLVPTTTERPKDDGPTYSGGFDPDPDAAFDASFRKGAE